MGRFKTLEERAKLKIEKRKKRIENAQKEAERKQLILRGKKDESAD